MTQAQGQLDFTGPQRTVLLETGRKLKAKASRMRGWEIERDRMLGSLGGHGKLNGMDLVDFQEAQVKILGLMLDGAWHEKVEMRVATGQEEAPRRMRQLRPVLEKLGYRIECKRFDAPGRVFKYRIVKVQGELA